MGSLAEKWGALFRSVETGKGAKICKAEEGYYLFCRPEAGGLFGLQAAQCELEQDALQKIVAAMAEGVSIRLNGSLSRELDVEDYHVWADPFAPEIDSGEIRAEAYVDLTVFLDALTRLARQRGFNLWRDYKDSKYLEIRCTRFRQPINLFRQLARMVMRAESMMNAIAGLLQVAATNCNTLLAYSQKFFEIFSNYRVFVGDHHFVVGRDETDLTPGLDYWALLTHPEKQDQIFWQGVDAVKKILTFSERKIRMVN